MKTITGGEVGLGRRRPEGKSNKQTLSLPVDVVDYWTPGTPLHPETKTERVQGRYGLNTWKDRFTGKRRESFLGDVGTSGGENGVLEDTEQVVVGTYQCV